MKINNMREFIRLSENRNYTKTAEELYIAQSALSRHIASIEEELNVKLINRDRNTFSLTPAGEMVVGDFQKILSLYEKMLEKLARLDDIESGEIRLGYLYYDADYYVSKIRDTFHKHYPKIKLVLIPYDPLRLEEDLLSGRIDAALIYGVDDCPLPTIEYMPFLKIPYTLIYDPSHRFSDLKDISPSDLNGEKLLVPEKDFQINHVSVQWQKILSKAGAQISEAIPINNYDEIPWILEETGAIYCSPMVNRNPYGEKVESRLLLPDLFQTSVSAVWLKNQPNPAVRVLLTVLRICYS